MVYATLYSTSELGGMGIDIAGLMMQGIKENTDLIIVVFVLSLVALLFTMLGKLTAGFAHVGE